MSRANARCLGIGMSRASARCLELGMPRARCLIGLGMSRARDA